MLKIFIRKINAFKSFGIKRNKVNVSRKRVIKKWAYFRSKSEKKDVGRKMNEGRKDV